MKYYISSTLIILFLLGCSESNQPSLDEGVTKAESREFYQLKIYTFHTEDQVRLTDEYLQNAFIPALKSKGLNNIGVFKNRLDESDSIPKTYVLIPFESIDKYYSVETQLDEDPDFHTSGSNYLEASYTEPPYQRIESVLMRAFSDMPVMSPSPLDGPRSDRVYELRSYESSTEAYHKNKVDMFNAGGEITLFERLGFNAVFYGEVISGSNMPNLMYMTTFSDRESRDDHWKSFVDSPEWNKMKDLPKYANNVSHIDIMLLYPTDYSDY